MSKVNPDPHDQPTFRPQNPIRISNLRRMWNDVNAAKGASLIGSSMDIGAGSGNQSVIDSTPVGFWARLTTPPQSNTDLYSFIEVQDDGTGDNWDVPSGPMNSVYSAKPLSGNQNIPVPGPPINLSGTPAGTSFYYVVTATWLNNYTGESVQSAQSNEISTSGGATLNWTAPAPCTGFTLTGYSIWRGIYQPGSEDTLAGTTNATTTSFSDSREGTPNSFYIPGGNAGPVVWMSPRAAYDDFYKFIDPAPLPPVIAIVNSSTPNSDGLYDATIQMYDPSTQTWSNGPNIWLRDANQ